MRVEVREIDLVIRNLGDNAPSMMHSLGGTGTSGTRKRKVCQTSYSSAPDQNETQKIQTQFAPVGLERQYNELYGLLEKGLIGVQEENRLRKTNVSALLMGGRGQGKSLVLERCLLALRQKAASMTMQQKQNTIDPDGQNGKSPTNIDTANAPHFRVVHLNGILLRGQNVTVAVQEIVSQLCEIVAEETHMKIHLKEHQHSEDRESEVRADSEDVQQKLHNLIQKETHRFRTRQTTFNSSMACLNEAFQISCIDSIPILIVLDELDSFLPKKNTRVNATNPSSVGRQMGASEFSTSSSSRDLLLYHLLDRIAGKGSLISLVGICARLTTTSSYEKRVRSRAQGTSKVVYFNLSKDEDTSSRTSVQYDSLVNILLSNFEVLRRDFDSTHDDGTRGKEPSNLGFLDELKQRVKDILLPHHYAGDSRGPLDEKLRDQKFKVHDIFKLNLECGKSIRWFCRVLSVALTLYVSDVQKSCSDEILPVFDQSYFLESLKIMGADSFVSESRPRASEITGTQDDLFEITPRLQDLMDLSGCQIAVLLSAKRILKRDRQEVADERLSSKPLTYERIRKEYESYFLAQGKSSGPDRYDESVFFTAFQQMLGAMIFPAKDHTGGGPNQYFFSKKFTTSGLQEQVWKKTPLHLGFHVDRDLMPALSAGKLKCSIALKDWAK